MRRWRQGVLTSAVTALLAGCAMGPDYERPEVPVPEDYHNEIKDGPSFATEDWWTLFEDPYLEALIETALANNKDMAVAIARIEEARAELGFVRADYFPTLDGQAAASRGNIILGVPGSINEQYVLAGNLSYELDLWGRVRRSNEAARATLLATLEARNVITTTLIADVAGAYLLLLDLDHRVDIAFRTRDTREDSLAIIEARYDKGTVPLIDVNQAQIELADAEAELASLERERALAENLLSVLLGANPGAIDRPRISGKDVINIPEVPAGLPSELLERRPDVRQASATLQAQTARIGVAQAQRFPTLSLTGTLGLVSPELDGFISSDNKAWSIGGSLLGPIFDAGRSSARVEAERARTEQAVALYEQTVLIAFQEVEDSLIEIQTYRMEARARELQVVAATSAATLSRARYDGGVTSYLEVLESERSLFRAELLASVTRRQQLVSLVELYKALGGGWPTPEEIEAAGNYENAIIRPESRVPVDPDA